MRNTKATQRITYQRKVTQCRITKAPGFSRMANGGCSRMNKPDYEYLVSQSNFLFKCMTGIIIFDKNLGRMSVTNGIEIVLSEIKADTREYLEWPPLIVIYRDSEKMFSSIQLGCKGQFLSFTFADKDPAVILQIALELAVENRRRVIDFAQSDRNLFSRYTLDLIKRYLS